jgi:NAD(P)-dependent dehydrogenase (short-subunit alcohol dehydrogenase family)
LAATRGYVVAVNFMTDRTAAQEVVRDVEHLGSRAIAIQADPSSEADVLQLFSEVDKRFGALDALVKTVGVFPLPGQIDDINAVRVNSLFATNVTSAFLCAREAVRRMSIRKGGQGGAIVNVSSFPIRLGISTECLEYAVSMSAVDHLTIGLAAEVASQGIRVNAVRPGLIADREPEGNRQTHRNSMTIPMNRAGRLEEIAHAILWLLSDEASFTNGTLLDVSGGL